MRNIWMQKCKNPIIKITRYPSDKLMKHNFPPYRLLMLLLILFLGKQLFCLEAADSIKNNLYQAAIEAKNDSLKALNFIRLGVALHASDVEIFKNKSGKDYLLKATELALQKHCFGNIGYFLDSIGVAQRNQGNYTTALHLHNLVIDFAKKVHDSLLMSYAYNNAGVVYRRIDDYKQGLSSHLQAYKLAEKRDDSVTMAIAINCIGNIEVMMGDYDEGLKYFKKSLTLEQHRKNLVGIAINLENIGTIFLYKKMYNKANDYFKLSLTMNENAGSKKGIAICYSDLAETYTLMGKYYLAKLFLNKSLTLNKKIEDKIYLADNYLSLGKIYAETGKFAEANSSLLMGLKLSKEMGVKSNIEKAYHTLCYLLKKRHQYKKALEYLEAANMYHDSVLNVSIQKDVARLQIQYESDRKENKIMLLEQQAKIRELKLSKQKFLNYFFIASIVLSLVVVAFLSVYLFNKSKLNRLLMEKNLEIENARNESERKSVELLEAKKKAEYSDRSKSEFLANMSHEIRTPLNSVIGFSDLLFDVSSDPKLKQYANAIKSSGQSLLILINDLLDLSKIEAGKFEVVMKPVNLAEGIEELRQLFMVHANEKGLNLAFSIDESFPGKIIFSAIRLRQILFNLIGNALKFTKKGKISVNVQYESDTPGMINIRITVKDTGIGIPKEEQERIFNPFYQSENNDTEMGTGLGLAITYRLVQALNGKIALKSKVGTGSKFVLSFDNIRVVEEGAMKNLPGKAVLPFNILLLDNKNDFSSNLLSFLQRKVQNVCNVGTRLQKAKEILPDCKVVIVNGFAGEMFVNSMHLLSKVTPDNLFIVIGSPQEISVKNIFFIEEKLPVNKILNTLDDRLKRFRYKSFIATLFFDDTESLPQGDFANDLTTIVNNEFRSAMESKMLQHISTFSQKVAALSKKYQLPAMLQYAEELNHLIDTFEISGIEEKLKLFLEAYHLQFSPT